MDGAGIVFVEQVRIKPSAEVSLRAVPDLAIRGRVVDTEGKPRAGVRVAPEDVSAYQGNSLDSFLAMWKARPFYGSFPSRAGGINLRKLDSLAATTDKDGRFEVRGPGAGRLVTLHLSGAGVADTEVVVATREGFDPAPYNQATRHKMPKRALVPQDGSHPVLNGPVVEAVIEAEKPIRGVVTDGELLMGGASGSRGGAPVMTRFKAPMADPDYPRYFGSFAGTTTFLAPGGDQSPVQGNACKVLENKPGTREVKQDIVLDPADALAVSIRDPQGRPLSGVWFAGQSKMPLPQHCEDGATTVYGLDASTPRLLVFFSPDPLLAATLRLTANQTRPVIATLGKTGTLKGRLTDADGNPLAGVTVIPKYRDRTASTLQTQTPLMAQVALTDAGGSFTLSGVIPGLDCDLTFQRQSQRFGPPRKPPVEVVGSGEEKGLGNLTVRELEEN